MRPSPSIADPHAAERDRVRAVRMQLVEHHPFWAYLLMQVELVFDEALPAYAATDCVRHIWLNPVRTASLSLSQLGFVLMHEVGHQLHAVEARRQGRHPRLWHQAVDYVINRIVADISHPWYDEPLYAPPSSILLNRKFDRLVAEAIYERLLDTAIASENARPLPRPGADQSSPSYRTESGQWLDGFDGGLDLHPPVVEAGELQELLRDRVRAAVARYEAEGRRGDIPGAAELLLADVRARVPWQRVLRQYANQYLARDEYDPRRPNRRWASEGFLVPGIGGERPGHIVVAIDSSGSMSKEMIAEALAEIRAIAELSNELTVIVADAEVQEVVGIGEMDRWLRQRRVVGGGGTDHRPVFDEIAKSKLAPDLFIGLTDLESAFPERAPPYPVLWVAPAGHGAAPWGRVVGMG